MTRKRFVKKLMGDGATRNEAEQLARNVDCRGPGWKRSYAAYDAHAFWEWLEERRRTGK